MTYARSVGYFALTLPSSSETMDPGKPRVISAIVIGFACLVSLVCTMGVLCSLYVFDASASWSEAWPRCVVNGTSNTLHIAALVAIVGLVVMTPFFFFSLGMEIANNIAATLMAKPGQENAKNDENHND